MGNEKLEKKAVWWSWKENKDFVKAMCVVGIISSPAIVSLGVDYVLDKVSPNYKSIREKVGEACLEKDYNIIIKYDQNKDGRIGPKEFPKI